MPRYTDLTPLFIFTSRGQPCKQEKCSSERPQPPALHLKWVRALDMLIWPLVSILNLHQTHFIEHSKNPDNEWKLVTVLLAMIHLLDNIDIRVYKRLMMFYQDSGWFNDVTGLAWCCSLVLIDTRHVIGDQLMGWGHAVTRCHADTGHLSRNYYPGPDMRGPRALLSPQKPGDGCMGTFDCVW